MNTNLKGQTFEDLVFAEFHHELENDNLFVSANKSKIFQRKAYFSRDRGRNILTDISIETSLPNAKEYSLLTVIECKDYSSAIPVSDIEEFHAKIQQISGDNIKAIFVTSNAFQKSALTYARSKKIALIRYLAPNQIQWVHFHMTPDEYYLYPDAKEFEAAFLDSLHIGIGREFFSCYGERNYGGLLYLLKALIID